MRKDDCLLDELVEIKPRKTTLTLEELEGYEAEAKQSDCGTVDLLVKKGVIKSIDVARVRAAQFGIEFVDLENLEISLLVTPLISRELAHRFQVVPLKTDGDTITVATADPSNLDTIDALHQALGVKIEVKVASEEAIEAALRKHYS